MDANMSIGKADGMIDPKGQVADGPAVATPPVTHPSPEKMLEQIKAKIKASANPVVKPAETTEKPKDGEG